MIGGVFVLDKQQNSFCGIIGFVPPNAKEPPNGVCYVINLHSSLSKEERLYEERGKIKGLKMVYEPENLRFFQARFEVEG